MNCRNIRVLMVRHGEREDEAARKKPELYLKRHTMTKKQKLDPSLTTEGYDQAAGAFSNIFNALYKEDTKEKKGVAIFCSPLRRTVGTALMIASAIPKSEDNQTLTQLPITDQKLIDSSANKNSKIPSPANIPVVIANGLCDCAAYVVRTGGAGAAVAKGLIDCAAETSNDYQIEGTPFSEAVSSMLYNIKDSNYGKRRSQKISPAEIQFWRRNNHRAENEFENDFLPMTIPFSISEPTTLSPSLSNTNEDTDPFKTPPPTTSRRMDSSQPDSDSKDDDFYRTVNYVTYLTAKAGLDTCIIVTHREGIRFLAERVCDFASRRISTPYCCIGSFTGRVKFGNILPSSEKSKPHYSIKWTLHGVHPYELFQKQHLPSLVEGSAVDKATTNIVLSIPGVRAHVMSAILSSPNNLPSPQWSLGKEIILTEYCANYKRKVATDDFTAATLLEFTLVDGRRGWLKFLKRTGKDHKQLIGKTTLIRNKSNDGSEGEENQNAIVKISISQNRSKFPCPPNKVWMEIIESTDND